MNQNPLVTIIIPIYNGSNYMREAIDSALAQTYDNIEIIVVNDGSTDNTDEIARSYGKKIRYLKKKNGGVSTALNLGIKKSKGEYISWLSHDDIYAPEKISTQVNALLKLPLGVQEKTIVYSNFVYIDEKSQVIRRAPIHKYHRRDKLDTPLYPIVKGLVNGCTLLIPKICFDQIGLFDEKLRNTQDYILWLKMFPKYHVLFQKNYLVYVRQHSARGTNTQKAQDEFNDFWITVIDTLANKDKQLLDGSITNFYFSMYKQMLRFNNPKAMKYAKKRYDECNESSIQQMWRELIYKMSPITNRINYIVDTFV